MEQGWSEPFLITMTGIAVGIALIIFAIRSLFGGGKKK